MQALQLFIYRHLPKPVQRLIRRTLFPTYLVAAKVLVTSTDGLLLVVKTTYGPGWDIPSGHCDRHESPTDAAAREVLEETGVAVTKLQQQAVIFQPKSGTIQVVFTATAADDSIIAPDNIEVSEVRWVSENEVKLNCYAMEAIEVVQKHKAHYWVSTLGH
ncbi:MAG: NUDIX hydrolase [Pseudomonadota bacterium]